MKKQMCLRRWKILSIQILLLFLLLVSSCSCNQVYKALCTPTIFQIRELIRHAFDRNVPPDNVSPEFRSWTTAIELREFCRSNGHTNEALPERIKVSKISKISSVDQVDILLTVKVPISRFYVDEDQPDGYRYWLMYKWPFEPFFCPPCRAFLTYSAEKNSSQSGDFDFLYGMMQNRFPSIVNPETLETIRRENKKEFLSQQFNFQEGMRWNITLTTLTDKSGTSPSTSSGKLPTTSSTTPSSTSGTLPSIGPRIKRIAPSDSELNSTQGISKSEATQSMAMSTDHKTTDYTTSPTTVQNKTRSIAQIQNVSKGTSLGSSENNRTPSTVAARTNATTNQKNDLSVEMVKKTIYVNLSSFAPMDKYFLVGMNMSDEESNRAEIRGRRKREAPSDRLTMRAGQFYLEYSLCYHVVANFYQPSANCYPLFVDDQLRHASAESLAIADCVCWRPHAIKSILFYQVILFFVIAALCLVFCNKFHRRSVLSRNLATSKFDYTHTPGQQMGAQSKVVLYQVLLQIHNPDDNSCRLTGRLNVKLFSGLNQPFYELTFTPESRFSRPFLFSEDVLRSTSYIQSDTMIWNVKKLVVEFEPLDEHATSFLYLYGIVITDGFHSTFTFPYSNYLPHRTEVHLSERAVWQNYMSRHEGHIPLSEMLPICNPKYIRLSRIEKLVVFVIFVSKFATAPLHLTENEDVHWLFQFITEMFAGATFYTLLFAFHVLYAKPALIREFFFIKLHFEFLEFKFVRIFIFVIVANSLFSSTYDIRNNLWKDQITVHTLRSHEQTLLRNDLFWAVHFFSLLVLFTVFAHFMEDYFYESRKKQTVSPGPSNALSDRLMNNSG